MDTNKFTINHRFMNITEWLQETILNICNEHITKMSDSYLKPYFDKTDANIGLQLTFEKNKQEKFEGKFIFNLDGTEVIYSNDVPFVEALDVVNHAFKRLKESLANK